MFQNYTESLSKIPDKNMEGYSVAFSHQPFTFLNLPIKIIGIPKQHMEKHIAWHQIPSISFFGTVLNWSICNQVSQWNILYNIQQVGNNLIHDYIIDMPDSTVYCWTNNVSHVFLPTNMSFFKNIRKHFISIMMIGHILHIWKRNCWLCTPLTLM